MCFSCDWCVSNREAFGIILLKLEIETIWIYEWMTINMSYNFEIQKCETLIINHIEALLCENGMNFDFNFYSLRFWDGYFIDQSKNSGREAILIFVLIMEVIGKPLMRNYDHDQSSTL